jgi:hypothetical protein
MVKKEDASMAAQEEAYSELAMPLEQLGSLANFATFAMSEEDKTELLEDLIGTGGLNRTSLPKIKVPAGGSRAWDLGEGEPVSKIKGIILAKKEVKVFYLSSDTLGTPPDCSSEDCIKGTGIIRQGQSMKVTRECRSCPNNQWGSSPKGGKGKACSDRLIMAILLEDSLLPMVLNVPPTSIKAMDNFVKSVVNKTRRPLNNFIVELSLNTAEGPGGIKYSVIDPKMIEVLPAEAKGPLRELRERAKVLLDSMPFEEIAVEETDSDPDDSSFD